jgi:hypothetical protein
MDIEPIAVSAARRFGLHGRVKKAAINLRSAGVPLAKFAPEAIAPATLKL